MGEIGRKLCGLGRSPNNLLMVSCGDGVVVAAVHNDVTTNDVATADDVVAAIGAVAMVDV